MYKPVVTLTESEMQQAGMVAVARHAENVVLGRAEAHGAIGNLLDPHFVGAVGECAVAKYLNRFWSGAVGNIKAKDVGDIQVRASLHSNPSLILHDSDPDEDCFVLASIAGNAVTLHGWVFGKEGKRPEYWRTDTKRPAYFVKDLSEMPRLERGRPIKQTGVRP